MGKGYKNPRGGSPFCFFLSFFLPFSLSLSLSLSLFLFLFLFSFFLFHFIFYFFSHLHRIFMRALCRIFVRCRIYIGEMDVSAAFRDAAEQENVILLNGMYATWIYDLL